jgi:hypothetical protein
MIAQTAGLVKVKELVKNRGQKHLDKNSRKHDTGVSDRIPTSETKAFFQSTSNQSELK